MHFSFAPILYLKAKIDDRLSCQKCNHYLYKEENLRNYSKNSSFV